MNFNPRFREGSDTDINFNPTIKVISIHASAKEATVFISKMVSVNYISIHASAKEATEIF